MTGPALMSDTERTALLNAAIAQEVARGGRVESIGHHMAVLVYGRKVNHVLHALLTFLLCGLWAVVWLVLVLSAQEVRITLTVDAYGVVHGLPERLPESNARRPLDAVFPHPDTGGKDILRQVLIAFAIMAVAIVVLVVIAGAV